MNDDNVIELPADYLPEAVRREMSRQKREAAALPDAVPEPDSPEPGPEPLPSLDKLPLLPRPGDPYKAYARPSNQMVPTLYVLTGDGKRWGFPYASRLEGPHMLAGDDPGDGEILVIRFNVSVAVELTLCGHNLDELHNYLGDHRIRWVREVPKGRIAKAGGFPVITRVKIERVAEWPPPGMG